MDIEHGSLHGPAELEVVATACPNPACRELTITAQLRTFTTTPPPLRYRKYNAQLGTWQLRPDARAQSFPDYIPAPILTDYREACLVRQLSPKASATLARRCLQGMIRDFWGISKSRLVDEIAALEDKVDPTTWTAIDAVRKIGNIGAHMERDINLVVDVDPNEAELLIGLIETLLREWYVARHAREQRMAAVIALAADKKPHTPNTTDGRSDTQT